MPEYHADRGRRASPAASTSCDLETFSSWLERNELPDNLKSEMVYYRFEVEHEEPVTLSEGVWEWITRHELEPKAGWLHREDLDFIRRGLIESGVAKPVSRRHNDMSMRILGGTPRHKRIWFTRRRIAYEYAPNED